MSLVSNIYSSKDVLFKIGERKGKTKQQIDTLTKKKLNKKTKKYKTNTKMDKGQSEARKIKIQIKEYPNYYVDGTGLICYKIDNGYRHCKKAGKEHTYLIVDGKQIIVNESEIADKYLSNWRQYRKGNNDSSELTINEFHNYLQMVISTKFELRHKIEMLYEYTNKIINKDIEKIPNSTLYLKEDETIQNNKVIHKDSEGLPNGQSYIKKKGKKGTYFKQLKNI